MNNGNDKTIVGIDPGTTSAVAVLDLRGNLKGLESGKNLSTGDLINIIVEYGQPVLIATDKAKLPSSVDDISSNFKAVTFSPDEDLSIRRKKELVQGYEFDNLHERDSLAAAIYAFNSYQNKFRSIESKLEELNIDNLTPEIKELVVTGKADNVSEAIEIAMEPQKENKSPKIPEKGENISEEDLKDKIENFRSLILKERKDKDKLREHNEKLKEEINKLKNKNKSLIEDKNSLKQNKRDEIIKKEEIRKRDKKIRSRDNRIDKLEEDCRRKDEKLEKLETFEELRKEGKVPLREIGDLSESELRGADRYISLNGSVLLVGSLEDRNAPIELLKDLGVEAIVADFPEDLKDILVSEALWPIPKEEVDLGEKEGVKYMDREVVEKSKDTDKGSFLDWLKRYRDKDV